MDRIRKKSTFKLTASSLTEVIVATTILLLVFAIALLTLNNIMVSTLQKDTQNLDTEIEKLVYQYRNNQLKVPFSFKDENMLIDIRKITQPNLTLIEFSIIDENKNKTRSKIIIGNINED